MSLAPLVAPEIRGVEGKDPGVHDWCSIPGCISRSQQGHHIWARSFLRGQPQNWVRVPSGATIANKTGVCRRHHSMLTGEIGGHMAWIKLEHGDVLTYWEKEGSDEWKPLGQLHPQPKVIGGVHKEPEKAKTQAQAHLHLEPGQSCDRCGYTRPKKREPQPKRKAALWGVTVPDDAEIGGEILDDWVEQFGTLIGLDIDSPRLLRYHVISIVFAWAMQNREVLLADIAEAASA